ncbi:hypothetical protein [Desulfurococcus amylolyticus]|uniref:hypothetical protein n=1 Tax=Desulfurococcus amylolyticus TaxID=94694 RepID=UPI0005B2236B|nr:hypothetical protein [Desulfurococcus amylolyticus]
MSDDGERDNSHVLDDKILECMSVYGLYICKGDVVQVFPRSRSLASVIGRVKALTSSSIVLENDENTVAIRISEIKMIRIAKFKRI